MGLSSELSCEAGNLFCFLSLHRFFQSEALRLYFPPHWNPGLHGLSCSPVVPSGLSTCKCGTARSSSRCLTTSPLRPGCPSPSLLILVWMNVSSLTPWLLDLYTVRFSGSSGYFLFLICCCPFGCVRRQSVSIYASILAVSLDSPFFINTLEYE